MKIRFLFERAFKPCVKIVACNSRVSTEYANIPKTNLTRGACDDAGIEIG